MILETAWVRMPIRLSTMTASPYMDRGPSPDGVVLKDGHVSSYRSVVPASTFSQLLERTGIEAVALRDRSSTGSSSDI